ncbi:MAG: RDD family protein [Syntrophales bacterium]|nr:RDD family protein [Syntrophales bacterium]
MTNKGFGGFWRRLWAYMVDKFILYLLSLILFLIGLIAMGLGGVSPWSIVVTGDLPRGMGFFMALYLMTALLMDMVYYIWFHGTVGQTLGKRLLGLRVIRISGEKMTLGIAFLRWVGSLVSGIFFFLGFLWIAFDGRKQGWHDKIAATLVVRVRNEPSPEVRPTAHSPLDIRPLTDAEPPSSILLPASIPPVTTENVAEPPGSTGIMLPETGPSGQPTENPLGVDSVSKS